MATFTGAGAVIRKLRERSLKGAKLATFEVGYTAPYAVYVHENLEAYHPIGQAKFLEQPARTLRPQIRAMVREGLLGKRSLESVVSKAGDFLLSESLKLVPIDTGFLYDSGYARVVKVG